MEKATIFEIIAAIVLAVAFIIFLIRRNVKDEEDTNPELTKALEEEKKDLPE
ncbi:FeoB-associated Cys-rich membrane protein [Mucilaginibacter paludis]|uniref:Uncharacterized protein n=1 Tax=Mucilaginibacter paludis DSM 18603 TaxID=714943 RepID=H1YAJ1_9SPHI|nr:FeoB-associated Cys-rich membrane protein [Mucilaginibacter paludis]EHQ29111.1 hypothetical protein Mucpa_5032 [Mucilaginibacter paludis DSM 18603]